MTLNYSTEEILFMVTFVVSINVVCAPAVLLWNTRRDSRSNVRVLVVKNFLELNP